MNKEHHVPAAQAHAMALSQMAMPQHVVQVKNRKKMNACFRDSPGLSIYFPTSLQAMLLKHTSIDALYSVLFGHHIAAVMEYQ
jgi:hypothetical protein